MTTSLHTPLSVLDLALVGTGQTSADALHATSRLARRAEDLGAVRFWVAEHHNIPSVASTSPAVLIAHLAATTSRMRVGSGGVMLPNHPPLVVAEQFAMLEALHPGRIDLGIGRAPGTDPTTAAALRRSPDALGADDFSVHLTDLLGMLGDRRMADGLTSRLRATPSASGTPNVFLLGSSGFSAQLAGMLGLPFAFAHHFSTGNTLPAMELYRRSFRPSHGLGQPYAVVTASVVIDESAEQAQWFARPSQLMMLSLRSGRPEPLPTPEAAARHPHAELAAGLPTTQIVATPDVAVSSLRQLVADTEADELMITIPTHGPAERLRSLELLASAWDAAAVAESR